jgi:hypothetical protein
MDWAGLAELVAPIAPTLGRALGNTLPIPFGGSIGQAAGEALAGALGVAADPNVIATTLQQTPSDVVKAQLADVEAAAQAKFAAIAEQAKAEASVGAAQVAAVGETQRAELITGEWYQRWWRPALMFLWAATMPFQAYELLANLHSADPSRLTALPQVILALTTWNGPWAAVAGVYSWNRTAEKIAALGNGH